MKRQPKVKATRTFGCRNVKGQHDDDDRNMLPKSSLDS